MKSHKNAGLQALDLQMSLFDDYDQDDDGDNDDDLTISEA